MTTEEFSTIYLALRLANNGYTTEDVATLVALEGKAWTVLQQIKARTGLSETDLSGTEQTPSST